MNKVGKGEYRLLYFDDSEESEKAINFFERLGIAYVRMHFYGQVKGLPKVNLSNGRVLVGLEGIIHGLKALGPVPSETIENKQGAEEVWDRIKQAAEEVGAV